MALVLSLKDSEIVYIGKVPFIICDIQTDHFHIENLLTNVVYKVETTKMVEIQPEVKVSSGPLDKYNRIKLVVEAPRDIIIIRKERRNVNTQKDNE